MKFEKLLPIVGIFIVIGYGIYNYINKQKSSVDTSNKATYSSSSIKKTGKEAVISYIKNVIINGSNRLHLKGSPMQGGYVSKKDAYVVACYVYELSGKKCNKNYSKEASLLYSSNCAGCHGYDGKGIKGVFPDLTKLGR